MKKSRLRSVKVRRERPGAVVIAVAAAITALMIYLITINAMSPNSERSNAGRMTEYVYLEPASLYCVSLAECKTELAARAEAAKYVKRGAAGYVCGADKTYHALGAGYNDASARDKALNKLGMGTPVDFHAEGVTMRITAAPFEIEAVKTADSVLREQALLINELALGMDKLDVSPSAARAYLAVAATSLKEALDGLSTLRDNAVISGLYSLVSEFYTSAYALSEKKDAEALLLSSEMKYNYIRITLRQIEYMNALNAKG